MAHEEKLETILDINVKKGLSTNFQSHAKEFGKGSRSCRACFNRRGLIRKYDLDLCRRCFREYALEIGFVKVD